MKLIRKVAIMTIVFNFGVVVDDDDGDDDDAQ